MALAVATVSVSYSRTRAIIIEECFVLNFLIFLFLFVVLMLSPRIFLFRFPKRGILSVPDFFPSVKFSDLGNISSFFYFACFFCQEQEENQGKKSSLKTALTRY